jgi:hypothetical protein
MTKKEYETRRDACAWIFMADRSDTIGNIMADQSIDKPIEAARLYVNGILSRMVRTGETRNRIDALEKLESSQVESRYAVMPTINKLARTVARLNRKTGRDYIRILPDGTREEIKPVRQEKRAHVATTGIGRFYGSIYIELERAEQSASADAVYNDSIIDSARARANEIAREYIREYMQGLTSKARDTIGEIKAMEKNPVDTRDAMRDKVMYLYRDFPARDMVSAREYARLLKAYA